MMVLLMTVKKLLKNTLHEILGYNIIYNRTKDKV